MEFFNQDNFLPTLLFLLFFGLAFSILELLIVMVLNYLEAHYWKWMIDVVIRSKLKHGATIRFVILVILALLVAGLLIMSPFIEIMKSTDAVRLLAIALPFLMIFIYLFNVRKGSKLKIEKQMYGVIFSVISIITYGMILAVANDSYDQYVLRVNNELINPGLHEAKLSAEANEKARLLDTFREDFLNKKCSPANYNKDSKENIITHLVFVANEPELAFGNQAAIDAFDPNSDLIGVECKNETDTFLLTEGGTWYWISEEKIDF